MPVFRDVKSFFQRTLGMRRHFSVEQLEKNGENFGGTVYYRLRADSAFKEGWYMLSVQADTLSIGHNLTIFLDSTAAANLPGEPYAHCLLGSHTHSKRIIYLNRNCRELFTAIESVDANRRAPAVEFTRISSRFAMTRMKTKMRFAGMDETQITHKSIELEEARLVSVSSNSENVLPVKFPRSTQNIESLEKAQGSDSNDIHDIQKITDPAQLIYQKYSRLMERHVRRIDYSEWLSNRRKTVVTEGSTDTSKAVTIPKITLIALDSDIDLDNVIGVVARSSDKLKSCLTVICSSVEEQSLSQQYKKELANVTLLNHKLHLDAKEISKLVEKHCEDYVIFTGGNMHLMDGCLDRLLDSMTVESAPHLIYTDHDIQLEDGSRCSPVFKPEWNPELLMSGNYVGRFFAMSAKLFRLCAGLDASMGDSMHYELLLKAVLRVPDESVLRLPEILYQRTGSQAASLPFIFTGARDAIVLDGFLERRSKKSEKRDHAGFGRKVGHRIEAGAIKGSLRALTVPSSPLPVVDIIIPTRDKVDILKCCIESIFLNTRYTPYRIVVVDNGSQEIETKEYYEELRSNPNVRLLEYPGEFNYSAINNFAVSKSDAEVIVLLNNDTEVCNPGWLDELVSHALKPDVGCVGAKLYYSNGLVQHAGVIVGLKGVAGHAHRFSKHDADGYCGRLKLTHNVSAVTAACLAVRREVFNQVGGLDEVNLKVAYNDVDLCLKIKAEGYRNIWTPHAELYHHESLSRGSDDTTEKARRFRSEYAYMQKRWNTQWLNDPAYNPNLANDQEDFSLAA